MFCSNCGNTVTDDSLYCDNCGSVINYNNEDIDISKLLNHNQIPYGNKIAYWLSLILMVLSIVYYIMSISLTLNIVLHSFISGNINSTLIIIFLIEIIIILSICIPAIKCISNIPNYVLRGKYLKIASIQTLIIFLIKISAFTVYEFSIYRIADISDIIMGNPELIICIIFMTISVILACIHRRSEKQSLETNMH